MKKLSLKDFSKSKNVQILKNKKQVTGGDGYQAISWGPRFLPPKKPKFVGGSWSF